MNDKLKHCEHKHTGSYSPGGVYLCVNFRALLDVSEEGRKRP